MPATTLPATTLLKAIRGKKRVALAAAMVCRNPDWWSARERGDTPLTVDELLEIARAFDLEIALGRRGWRIDTL